MKISQLTLIINISLATFCALEIYSMGKEEGEQNPLLKWALEINKKEKEYPAVLLESSEKELKDRKESQDTQVIYSSDRRFMLERKADGAVSLFKVNKNHTLQQLTITRKTVDEDFPEVETYIFSNPTRTNAHSVTFSPDGTHIAIINGMIKELTYDHDKGLLSYENEMYVIQLYTVNPLTKKFILVQEVQDLHNLNQISARLTYLPNGKGACLWYRGGNNKLTFFNVNPQTGFLQYMHTATERDGRAPQSLDFSPNSRSAAMINYNYPASHLSTFALAINASSLPIKTKNENTPGNFLVKTIYYASVQDIFFNSGKKFESVAYSADSTLAAVAATNEQTATTSAGSGGIAEAKARNETAGGSLHIYNVNPQTGKFTPQSDPISLDFEPVAIAFNPRFTDIIVAGNTKSGGVIRRYGELRGAWKQWAEDTLPGQTITSLILAQRGGEEMAITTEQGIIEIRNSKTLSPINFHNTNSVVKAPGVIGPVAYHPQGTLAAAVVSGTVAIYTVDPITGAFTLLTDDLADYELKSRPIGFGPETEVMSVPNEMGGFRLVPSQEGAKILKETQERKVAALQHLIAQWEKELAQNISLEKKIAILKKWEKLAKEHQWANIIKNSDNPVVYNKNLAEIVAADILQTIARWEKELNQDIDWEQKIAILQHWAKVAQEKQWASVVKESPTLFKKQLQEARDAFEREAMLESEEINEAEIEQEFERLEKIAL